MHVTTPALRTTHLSPLKALTSKQLAGIYAAKLAVPGPYFAAEVRVSASGKYSVRVANIDSGPSPAMAGSWKRQGDKLVGKHQAPGLGEVTLTLNLPSSEKALKSKKGLTATVDLGGQVLPLKVVKTDKAFF